MTLSGFSTGGRHTDVQPYTWRAWCRWHAVEQAQQEARAVWQVGPNEPIPFNYRWEHVQEVVRLGLWLAKQTNADADIVEAAAWLHDVRKQQPRHGFAGAAAAEQILIATDFPPAKIAAVAEAIRQHVGLSRPVDAVPLQPVEVAVLWDADKLSKLGVQALVYNLSLSGVGNTTLTERWQRNHEFVDNILKQTVESMNTSIARSLAEKRYRDMVAMLDTWRQEELETGIHL